MNYGDAIREGFRHVLEKDQSTLVIGQGLWSPWYVGNTMRNLEKEFGKSRIIDTPVSELATTGAGVGLSLSGYRPIITHPRVDFALLALDQIVNQAAKWNSMFGGDAPVPIVFRLIVNRGGQQGAQHSQSLYSWFAHIPGLRVVTPATPQDAQDLLIAAVECNDPVVYIDDRWLYDWDDEVKPPNSEGLPSQRPAQRTCGDDLTLVGFSWTTRLLLEVANDLVRDGISASVIDLRVLNPLDTQLVEESVKRTGRLLVVEGDWLSCGIASEVIARVAESVPSNLMKSLPIRIGLANAPAPTNGSLEEIYYPNILQIRNAALQMMTRSKS